MILSKNNPTFSSAYNQITSSSLLTESSFTNITHSPNWLKKFHLYRQVENHSRLDLINNVEHGARKNMKKKVLIHKVFAESLTKLKNRSRKEMNYIKANSILGPSINCQNSLLLIVNFKNFPNSHCIQRLIIGSQQILN